MDYAIVQVKNLRTGQDCYYTCSPRKAVVCAYAQFTKKDFCTWDYDKNYDSLVEEGTETYLLGDWSTFKDCRIIKK